MPASVVAQMLRSGLYTAIVGRRVRFYQSTPSTMDDAAQWARDGADEGAVVVAETQTASRGRLGRRWVSDAGNLYCSVLFRPDAAALPLLNPWPAWPWPAPSAGWPASTRPSSGPTT